MSEVYFYHLTRQPLEAALRVLLEKSLQAGWRVAVRAHSRETMERLDLQLWLRPEDSFLPHGIAGGPHDADQPVLLTTDAAAPNDPQAIVSVEGAELLPEEIAVSRRAMILFDGHDEAALQTARAQWRSLTGAGVPAKYWSEDGGKWQMKAESGSPA